MKHFNLIIALIYVLSGLPAQATTIEPVVDLMHQSEFLKMSEQPLSHLWSALKPFLSKEDVAQYQNFFQTYPDFKIPKMSVTKVSSAESGTMIRVLMQYKSDMITIDFQEGGEQVATVNGVHFNMGDMRSFRKLYQRLAADDVGLKEIVSLQPLPAVKAQASSSWFELLWSFAVVQAMAAENACQSMTGSLCWDQVQGSFSEKQSAVKSQIESKKIAKSELFSIDHVLQNELKACEASRCPELPNLREKVQLVKPYLAAKNESKVREEKSTSTSSMSWLKPLALVAAGGLVLWGLCAKKVIHIFGCGKSSSSSTTTATAQPVVTPTSPLYTGTGTQ